MLTRNSDLWSALYQKVERAKNSEITEVEPEIPEFFDGSNNEGKAEDIDMDVNLCVADAIKHY